MPTYRDELHSGHKVPLVEADDICNGAVTSRKLADGAVTPRKLSPECETEWLIPLLDEKCRCMMKQLAELRQLVTSYTANGVALSRCFGPNDDIGISQRSITNEVRRIWNKLNELTGEPGNGICVTLSPDVIITDSTADVELKVTANDCVFEKVRVYVNDELAVEREYVGDFVEHLTLSETSCIRTVVQIMGVEYTDIRIATLLFSFYVGSGSVWTDAISAENAQPYKGLLRGTYNMTVNNEGDHIYVVIPAVLRDQMIRADMNGLEIPMVVTRHEDYVVFESINLYHAGSYNIDITDNCDCNCEGCSTETEQK